MNLIYFIFAVGFILRLIALALVIAPEAENTRILGAILWITVILWEKFLVDREIKKMEKSNDE